MRPVFYAGIALGLAGNAWADTSRFDGTYRINPDHQGCIVGEGDVVGAAFRIADGQLTSIESTCTLANPTNIRDMDAMLFDLECSGEGMEWSDRVFMMKKDDGSLLQVVDGMDFTYPPCTE